MCTIIMENQVEDEQNINNKQYINDINRILASSIIIQS